MPQHDHPVIESHSEPTILETQLDSMYLALTKMKNRLQRMPLADHLSDAERAQLSAAVSRAEARLFEVSALIREKAGQTPE